MSSIKYWISAFRPRTLFLAIAVSICGSGIAYHLGKFKASVCALTILISIILQLLSNLANDLGDFNHGTDITGNRVGPERALQSGHITTRSMEKAIKIIIILAAVVGLILIYTALQFMQLKVFLFFIVLGILAIIAAIKYTAGKKPYGYSGLGDLFSFLFFGPVAVIGTFYLHYQEIIFQPWLPAIGLGFLTASVLNLNNIRDIENDKICNKKTIPVKIGLMGAKIYHGYLTIGALLCFIIYSILYSSRWYQYSYILVFIIFMILLYKICRIKRNKDFDPYLKYTSLSTFLLSILFCLCINL